MRDTYKTTYHRDGTVTVWNIFSQTWMRLRAEHVSDPVLASLPEADRNRINRIAAKQAV